MIRRRGAGIELDNDGSLNRFVPLWPCEFHLLRIRLVGAGIYSPYGANSRALLDLRPDGAKVAQRVPALAGPAVQWRSLLLRWQRLLFWWACNISVTGFSLSHEWFLINRLAGGGPVGMAELKLLSSGISSLELN